MAQPPYVLATSCTEPDEAFTSVHSLARALVNRRGRLPGAASRAEPACVAAILARSDQPDAQVIAVRALDGSAGGKGAFLGYAFVPGASALTRLRQALADLTGQPLQTGVAPRAAAGAGRLL